MFTHQIKSYKPHVKVLCDRFRGVICDNCFLEANNLLTCSKCHYLKYCSKDCQKEHWDVHKKECKNLVKFLPNKIDDWMRFFAYIVQDYLKYKKLGLKEGMASENFDFDYSLARNDNEAMTKFYYQLKSLKKFNFDPIYDDVDTMLLLYMKAVSSWTAIFSNRHVQIGLAIFIELNDFKQSCQPNSNLFFSGCEMNLIMKMNQSIETTTFSWLTQPRTIINNERKQLLSRRFKTCSCSCCEDPTSDHKLEAKYCLHPNCSGYLVGDNNCTVCNLAPSQKHLNQIRDAEIERMKISAEIFSISTLMKENATDPSSVLTPDALTKFIVSFQGSLDVFPRFNHIINDAILLLYNKAVYRRQYTAIRKYLEMIVAGISEFATLSGCSDIDLNVSPFKERLLVAKLGEAYHDPYWNQEKALLLKELDEEVDKMIFNYVVMMGSKCVIMVQLQNIRRLCQESSQRGYVTLSGGSSDGLGGAGAGGESALHYQPRSEREPGEGGPVGEGQGGEGQGGDGEGGEGQGGEGEGGEGQGGESGPSTQATDADGVQYETVEEYLRLPRDYFIL